MNRVGVILLAVVAMGVFFGCSTQQSGVVLQPTATLAPVLSQTPRQTATQIPSRTPIPTFTFTPSETSIPPTPSDTPTPTEIPPIVGVVFSVQRVNVREGPGVTFNDFEAVDPNSELIVLGQSSDGLWFNIELEDGREGWISSRLLRLRPTETPFPTLVPTVDRTAIALGTVFPTAVVGGGIAITPSPIVEALISPTAVISVTIDPNATATNTQPPPAATTTPRNASINSTPVLLTLTPTPTITPTTNLPANPSVVPVVDFSTFETATALAAFLPSETPQPTATDSVQSNAVASPNPRRTVVPPTTSGEAQIQQRVDVLAYCDDPKFRSPAPQDLAAGSTIEVFWRWFAKTPELIEDHLANATYTITVDDIPITNLPQYQQPISQVGVDYVVDWFVPVGPLQAGEHRISYSVTWSESVFDGYDYYGPGSRNTIEEGSCTFVVR